MVHFKNNAMLLFLLYFEGLNHIYVYTSQLYCSKAETVTAKEVVNKWLQWVHSLINYWLAKCCAHQHQNFCLRFSILFTILFIYYIEIFQLYDNAEHSCCSSAREKLFMLITGFSQQNRNRSLGFSDKYKRSLKVIERATLPMQKQLTLAN